MLHRLKDIFDPESFRVWFATAAVGGITLTQLNAVLTGVMLTSTIIYTWVRILRKSKDNDDLE